MKKANSPLFLALALVPVLIMWLLWSIWYTTSPEVSLSELQDSSEVIAYSDTNLNGFSMAKVTRKDSEWIFTYTLRKGYAWPYAGVCFIPKRNKLESIGNTPELVISIHATKGKIVPLLLNEFIPGYTDTVSFTRFRTWSYRLKLEPGKYDYHIPFSEFELPANWLKETEHLALSSFNPKNIRNVCVQNCEVIPLNSADEIRLSAIRIRHMFRWEILGLVAATILWLSASFVWYLIRRKKKTVFIPYVATNSEIEPKDEWALVQGYLSEHYMEEVDMASMEKELGIARHRIAALIKENTSLIFKQYLNQIRVAEAKRLLTETILPIGEICDQVGFGHISHFNRVFKEYTQVSPSEFRKNTTVK